MGHDFSLTYETNKCDSCNRSDVSTIEDNMYVSYNHCWAFYDYVDSDVGFIWIYDRPVTEIIPKMELLKARLVFNHGSVPTHEKKDDGTIAWSDKLIPTINYGKNETARDDGWATTVFNAYRCADEILQACYKAVKFGHLNARFDGD